VALIGALGACSGGTEEAERPAAPATTTTTARPSGTFTALTYNVAGLPQGINPDQMPEQHQPLISPLLNAYDVVLLQEDFGFYTDVLRAEIDHEFVSEPHPGPAVTNPIGRESAAVGDGLNVLSRLPIGDLERVPWTGCGPASGDCLALKGFAATDLTLAPGTTVALYTLHVEAGRDDAALRGDDLDQLAAHLAAEVPGAVLIGGDWNLEYADDPDGEQLRGFLAATGLQDVCDVLDCGADADVIDRFLFRSGDDVTLTPTRHRFERETFVDGAGAPLSDHDPLAVDWSWST
jgi:endonuclease/exonuclease/phosphatase family metal-dependent hydrolase